MRSDSGVGTANGGDSVLGGAADIVYVLFNCAHFWVSLS